MSCRWSRGMFWDAGSRPTETFDEHANGAPDLERQETMITRNML